MQASSFPPRYRITSIDLLRGIVMVIMALDHVRDFFHNHAMTGDATDLATTTPSLFFTRWITHFCAPTFVFLAGVSAYQFGAKRSRDELSIFLLKRGLWLVAVEIVIVTLGWTFNPFYTIIILQVIWAIGISMMLLGFLVWLPFPVILTIGLLIVFGHNLLDYPEAVRNGKVGMFWDVAHLSRFSMHRLFDNHFVLLIYAFMPWSGVMVLGYCFGRLYQYEPQQRRRIFLIIGSAAVLLFIVLRFINHYGDPSPWSVQRNPTYTVLSFLNTTKYPPSLLYLLVTLGPSILFLAFAESAGSWLAKFFITYGRVPFFYYVLHIYLIHFLLVIAFFATGHTTAEIVSPTPFLFRPVQFGFNLWIVYGIWLLVVLLLYPLCRWYNQYKSSQHYWWLSYL